MIPTQLKSISSESMLKVPALHTNERTRSVYTLKDAAEELKWHSYQITFNQHDSQSNGKWNTLPRRCAVNHNSRRRQLIKLCLNTHSPCYSYCNIAIFSRINNLQFEIVVSCRQRLASLSESDVNNTLASTNVLQQLNTRITSGKSLVVAR
jgi:hypothetical protein